MNTDYNSDNIHFLLDKVKRSQDLEVNNVISKLTEPQTDMISKIFKNFSSSYSEEHLLKSRNLLKTITDYILSKKIDTAIETKTEIESLYRIFGTILKNTPLEAQQEILNKDIRNFELRLENNLSNSNILMEEQSAHILRSIDQLDDFVTNPQIKNLIDLQSSFLVSLFNELPQKKEAAFFKNKLLFKTLTDYLLNTPITNQTQTEILGLNKIYSFILKTAPTEKHLAALENDMKAFEKSFLERELSEFKLYSPNQIERVLKKMHTFDDLTFEKNLPALTDIRALELMSSLSKNIPKHRLNDQSYKQRLLIKNITNYFLFENLSPNKKEELNTIYRIYGTFVKTTQDSRALQALDEDIRNFETLLSKQMIENPKTSSDYLEKLFDVKPQVSNIEHLIILINKMLKKDGSEILDLNSIYNLSRIYIERFFKEYPELDVEKPDHDPLNDELNNFLPVVALFLAVKMHVDSTSNPYLLASIEKDPDKRKDLLKKYNQMEYEFLKAIKYDLSSSIDY